MTPAKIVEDPPGGWVLGRSPLLIGERRLLVFESVADAVKAAYTSQHTVITMSSAMRRSGFLR
jgi:hypothetical protein